MSGEPASPYTRFKNKVCTFANGQHGIRNPFIIAAVEPRLEHRLSARLTEWADEGTEQPELPEGVTVQPIRLDELLPRTDVYELLVDLGGHTSAAAIESTMKDQLAAELVQQILDREVEASRLETQQHVLLLLQLGSLYPFSRASELLDELDRRNVKSTIGIPFPGDVVGGKLSFFNTDSRHYYPAHQIAGKIREVHLQR